MLCFFEAQIEAPFEGGWKELKAWCFESFRAKYGSDEAPSKTQINTAAQKGRLRVDGIPPERGIRIVLRSGAVVSMDGRREVRVGPEVRVVEVSEEEKGMRLGKYAILR